MNIIEGFLKTGNLGELKLGLNLQKVINILSVSQDNLLQATQRRIVWESSGVNLSFFKGKLDIITIRCEKNKIHFPLELGGEDFMVEFAQFDLFLIHLKKLDVGFEPYPFGTSEELVCIKLTSEVRAYFKEKELSILERM